MKDFKSAIQCLLFISQNTVLSAKHFLQAQEPGKWNINYTKLNLQQPVPRLDVFSFLSYANIKTKNCNRSQCGSVSVMTSDDDLQSPCTGKLKKTEHILVP